MILASAHLFWAINIFSYLMVDLLIASIWAFNISFTRLKNYHYYYKLIFLNSMINCVFNSIDHLSHCEYHFHQSSLWKFYVYELIKLYFFHPRLNEWWLHFLLGLKKFCFIKDTLGCFHVVKHKIGRDSLKTLQKSCKFIVFIKNLLYIFYVFFFLINWS